MNTREKLEAIRSLAGRNVLKPYLAESTLTAKWLCDCGVVSGDGFVVSFYADGDSAEEAIDNMWNQVINLKDGLFISPDGSCTRKVRWNGFMWADV